MNMLIHLLVMPIFRFENFSLGKFLKLVPWPRHISRIFVESGLSTSLITKPNSQFFYFLWWKWMCRLLHDSSNFKFFTFDGSWCVDYSNNHFHFWYFCQKKVEDPDALVTRPYGFDWVGTPLRSDRQQDSFTYTLRSLTTNFIL